PEERERLRGNLHRGRGSGNGRRWQGYRDHAQRERRPRDAALDEPGRRAESGPRGGEVHARALRGGGWRGGEMTRAGGRAGMVLAVAMVAACGPTVSTSRQGPAPGAGMIRVGTSPDAPPVSFVRNGRFTGIEPDLAQALADQLRRPVQLIPMRWD